MVNWFIVLGVGILAFAFGMFVMALCAMHRSTDDQAELLRLRAQIKEESL